MVVVGLFYFIGFGFHFTDIHYCGRFPCFTVTSQAFSDWKCPVFPLFNWLDIDQGLVKNDIWTESPIHWESERRINGQFSQVQISIQTGRHLFMYEKRERLRYYSNTITHIRIFLITFFRVSFPWITSFWKKLVYFRLFLKTFGRTRHWYPCPIQKRTTT